MSIDKVSALLGSRTEKGGPVWAKTQWSATGALNVCPTQILAVFVVVLVVGVDGDGGRTTDDDASIINEIQWQLVYIKRAPIMNDLFELNQPSGLTEQADKRKVT